MNRLVAVCAAAATAMVSLTVSSAEAGPADTGAWSAPFEMGGVAIHSTLMHNGEVLIFEYVEGQAGVDRTSRVRVWDPSTGQARDANLGYDRDVFCAGHNVLPDGRVLVSGGHDFTAGQKQDPVGVAESDLYDPVSGTWSPTPPLGQKRWYPTNVGLGNGRTLIFGGQEGPNVWANTVDSYDPATNTMTTLPASATTSLNNNYPRLHLMPNGKVIKSGAGQMSRYFDPQTDEWSNISGMLYGNRTQGVSVLLPGLDKVMMIGGRSGTTATETAEVLDTSVANPQWRYTTPMHFPRIYANAVTLPDGQVLVVGGGAAGKYDGPVTAPELYNPATETWTVMESQLAGRMYHSTALLLPDGRVLSAGQDSGGYATMGEIFSPPYLFKGSRPTISDAPGSTGYGQSFSFTSPQAADISKVALIRPGSVTHTVNTEQRYVGLNFTTSGSTITATSPPNGNTAPPGYYMLFAVDSQGVPSVAEWVRVGGGSAPPVVDTVAPSVPGNVSAVGAAGKVDVSWSPSTDNVGVAGYKVRRGGDVIATVQAGTSYTDTAVAAGSTYAYTVQAFDAAGNNSVESAPASGTVPQDPPPGAVISWRGVATGSNATTASLTVPVPSSLAGDLLLATVDVRGQPVVTAPAGWNLVRTDTAGTTMRKATFWRLATASEPASYTWGFNKPRSAVGSILAYSGVSPTSPIQASSGQVNAASRSIAAPSLTTTTPSAMVVGLFGLARRATVTPATSMTERSEVASPTTVSAPATDETADRLQAEPGATGPQVATASTGGVNIGQLIALTPNG